jgi:GAF domain-containing protein
MSARPDETVRQRDLDRYHIVDSLPEAAYDDIVKLASMLCNTPIALVTLIDRDRQWFKASTGIAATGTRRDEAFCNHAIEFPDQLMQVPDTGNDPRFADNALVTGDLGVRFYAGMPLVTPGGSAIGTVCVLDNRPRELNDDQKAALASLARLTMTLFEARQRDSEHERAALLHDAAAVQAGAAPAAGVALRAGFTVALFEVQDFAGVSKRLGDRAMDRALRQFDEDLNAALLPGTGDSVSRASGSPETIVVLHGDDTDAALGQLRAAVSAFERETSLRVLAASAQAESADERLEQVFFRADAALSDTKDAAVASMV